MTLSSSSSRRKPVKYYCIRLEGCLDPCWAEWFEGMELSHTSSGESSLTGPVKDQAALHGLLVKIRDLNLTLVSVNEIEPGKESD